MLKESLFISCFLLSVIIALPAIPVTSVSLQKCIQTCTSQEEDAPICGSDDIMYDNMCTFNCAKQIYKDLIPVYDDPNKCHNMGNEPEGFKNKMIVKRNDLEENEEMARFIEFILHNSEGRNAIPVEYQAIPNRFEYAVENYEPYRDLSISPVKSGNNIPENIWSALYALRSANRQLMMARHARRSIINELDNIAMNLKNEKSKNVIDFVSNEIHTSSNDNELINRMHDVQNQNFGSDETGESVKNTRDMSRKAKALFNGVNTDESKLSDDSYWNMINENRLPKEDGTYGKEVHRLVESTSTSSYSTESKVGQHSSSEWRSYDILENSEPNESVSDNSYDIAETITEISPMQSSYSKIKSDTIEKNSETNEDSEQSSELNHSTESKMKESKAVSEDSLSTTTLTKSTTDIMSDLDEGLNESQRSTETEENVTLAETATEIDLILNENESKMTQELDNRDALNSSEGEISDEPNMSENTHGEHDTIDDINSSESNVGEITSNGNNSIDTETTHEREEKGNTESNNWEHQTTALFINSHESDLTHGEVLKEEEEAAAEEDNISMKIETSEIPKINEKDVAITALDEQEEKHITDLTNNSDSENDDIVSNNGYSITDATKEDQETTDIENDHESTTSDIANSNEPVDTDSIKGEQNTTVVENSKDSENSDIKISNKSVQTSDTTRGDHDSIKLEKNNESEAIDTVTTPVSMVYSTLKKAQHVLDSDGTDNIENESDAEEDTSIGELFFRNPPINSIEISSPVLEEADDSESDLFDFRHATPIDNILVGDDSMNIADHEKYVDQERDKYLWGLVK